MKMREWGALAFLTACAVAATLVGLWLAQKPLVYTVTATAVAIVVYLATLKER